MRGKSKEEGGREGEKERGGERAEGKKEGERRGRREKGEKGEGGVILDMWRSQSYDKRFTYCAVPEEDGRDKQDSVPQEHPVVHLGVLTRDRRWPLTAVVLFPDRRLLYSLVWEQATAEKLCILRDL